MDNSPLPFAETVRFLGLTLRQLSDMGITRMAPPDKVSSVTYFKWSLQEAGRTVMLRLYCHPIHFQLNYGSFIYTSASKIVLSIVDSIRSSAIHVCTGGL
jgi:hypothetical protein